MEQTYRIYLSEWTPPPLRTGRRTRWLQQATRFHAAPSAPPRLLRWRARPGDVLAVTGTPGLLRLGVLAELADVVRAAGGPDAVLPVGSVTLDETKAAIEQMPMGRGGAYRALSAVGLSSAWQQGCRAAQLGAADRWRLRLALALAEGRGAAGRLIAARRWCHELDGPSARRLCRRVRALTQAAGVCIALETVHAGLVSALRPDIHVQVRGGAPLRVGGPAAARFRIERQFEERGIPCSSY
jgi:hypothetical protein